MEVNEYLYANIERYVKMTQQEKERLAEVVEVEEISRKEKLDVPGQVCRYRNYIVKGAFRSYLLDSSGKEHTVQLAMDDWFVSDFYSYVTQKPATLFVEALEDSLILRMHYDRIETLCKEIHSLSEYFRVSTEKAFAYSRNRALSATSMSAEERYQELYAMYPKLFQKIPQKYIASYLGMTPEFLSKVRKRSH
ncbi:Crp/Fnr family transcriptional regulator [Croceivirga thetidis]|uniref:Crp/Fnr family transcriptional regulator n=1 Tax=Croceivirga thetidis TaxID=2721623 RepID=A0ABX1GNT7_9FLAO|nr:Crp/Fnr family transcriptional regulator [Croceivirga thetidis]NKI31573.1 Crp/Fnr family transcriptional regulator [Croceivirga thetidis]